LWHKNVDEETADEVIRRHEGQGWWLIRRKSAKNNQVTLVFEHAPLPELADDIPQKTRKKIPLRRRLRNHAIVVSIPLTIMCCVITYTVLTDDSADQRAANEAMMRYLRASFYGDAAADETCTQYRFSVQEGSTNPPPEWVAQFGVGDNVSIDGNRAEVMVGMDGYFARGDEREQIAVQDRFMLLKENGDWRLCDSRLERGIWAFIEAD
jgi:hypothetical protein